MPGCGCKRDTAALIAFIDSRARMPYAWGRSANDCVAFALAAAEAQTGERVAPDLDWTDEAGARAIIALFGSLEAAFDAFFDRVPPSMARRGDIAGIPDADFGIHPLIVEGETLVCPGERGNQRVKRRRMVIAWCACGTQPHV